MSGQHPSFGHIRGSGRSSLRARDAHEGKGGGRSSRKRLLNQGMTSYASNGNYISKRDDGGLNTSTETRAKEDDHAAEAALGFELFTDGPDRLGWLFNMNSVSFFRVLI